MGEIRNTRTCKFFSGNPEIKTEMTEREHVDWIHLAQDRIRCGVIVNTEMEERKFLTR
jgi:hypothetical protein